MKHFTKLTEHYVKKNPVVLTIGFFDGMHLGHQKVFQNMRDISGSTGYLYALTFANHPKSLTNPEKPPLLIQSFEDRISSFESQKIDALFSIPFTQKIKETSADEFITELMELIGFTDLVLGPDSTLGNNKEGNIELIQLLSKKFAFKLHETSFVEIDKQKISSTVIREQIITGDLMKVAELLGRPYSISAPLIQGTQTGTKIGFPTFNFEVSNLALPPLGVYKVLFNEAPAIANLGLAPTLQSRKEPVLEVHLLDKVPPLSPKLSKVTFQKFIRAEKKFHSLEELKKQISIDVEFAKTL